MSLFAMPKWQLSCPVDGWWFILLCSIVKRAIGRYRKIHIYIYIYIYILYFYDINRERISLFHCLHLIQCISLDTTHQRAPEKSTGLKLENYYFFTFTFSRPEVRKLLLFYVFTFSRPEVRKLFRIYVFTFSRPEVRKLLLFYVFTFSRPEVRKLFRIYVFTFFDLKLENYSIFRWRSAILQ